MWRSFGTQKPFQIFDFLAEKALRLKLEKATSGLSIPLFDFFHEWMATQREVKSKERSSKRPKKLSELRQLVNQKGFLYCQNIAEAGSDLTLKNVMSVGPKHVTF